MPNGRNIIGWISSNCSKFKLILGKYLQKSITCFRCGNIIHTHEEKETDVRIATQIVADAYCLFSTLPVFQQPRHYRHGQGTTHETIWKPFQAMHSAGCGSSWKNGFRLTHTRKVESISGTVTLRDDEKRLVCLIAIHRKHDNSFCIQIRFYALCQQQYSSGRKNLVGRWTLTKNFGYP